MQPPPCRTGPVFDIASCILNSHQEYDLFRSGVLSRAEFGSFLDRIAPELIAAGLPAEDVHFAKRYPFSESDFVRDQLCVMAERGFIPASAYDSAYYDNLASLMRVQHDHGPFRTYIYPEEARLLFALTNVLQPRSTLFLGSYYGYWAHAAVAIIAAQGGHAVFVDPDEKAQTLAFRNLEHAGLKSAVDIAVTTGQEYLAASRDHFDLVVLDAEGPRTHPDPELRGKAIYGPLLRCALPRMAPGAYLVCHNILFEDIAVDSYFNGVIARNRRELAAFLNMVHQCFGDFIECPSTEGVGVSRFSG